MASLNKIDYLLYYLILHSWHILQYLDLFQNELTTLPVSMCQLDRLRWLDVKDNPIHETLKAVAGDCLDEAQCKTCAKNVSEINS